MSVRGLKSELAAIPWTRRRLHAHVVAVVDREARGLVQVLLEQFRFVVDVDADLHALVDGLEHQLLPWTLHIAPIGSAWLA
jgi:hypothetical protein